VFGEPCGEVQKFMTDLNRCVGTETSGKHSRLKIERICNN